MADAYNYVNIAKGKTAKQSSLSEYSTKNGAAEAVSGKMPAGYAIHTAYEDNPWWMVDLEFAYPIDQIVIHNRTDGYHERAKNCRVDISVDGKSWKLIHAGNVHFMGAGKGEPLRLPLRLKESARYVLISLPEKEFLHLSQVEVFADPTARIRDRYRLHSTHFNGLYQMRKHPEHFCYTIEGGNGDPDVELIGLRLKPVGRLGNQIIQIINAVAAARRLKLRYIAIVNGGLINVTEPMTLDGITFLPTGAEFPEPGAVLAGGFFFRNDLLPLLEDVSRVESYAIVQDIIAPFFMLPLPMAQDVKYDDELTIHLRAGDIFNNPAAAAGYTQPPLSFYTLLIKHCLAQREIKRIRLVYESFDNPCVGGLIKFLGDAEIPYRTQNATLAEDLAALVDAKYLVFGFGSFGIAATYLSKSVDTVFCFKGLSETAYIGMPSVKNVVMVRDVDGKYTKAGEWRKSPAQLEMMMDYPETSLEVVDIISQAK